MIAGNYNVLVSDAFGCSTIDSVEVSSPGPLTIAETVTNETCAGVADGSIEVSASGAQVRLLSLDSLTQVGSTVQFNNLPFGTYQVIATDGNACQANGSYSIAPGKHQP